jgi:protein O-GlcNAc transferase
MEHHQAGDLDRAGLMYREVLAHDPGHPDALHLFGLVCHQQGDHDTAVSYIQRAVDQVPDQAVLRNNLGDAMRQAGEPERAIEQLLKALELQPEYAGAHLNAGAAYLVTGEHEAALVHAREACRLEPTRAESWFNLGLVLREHVMLDESIDALGKALQLRPEYPAAAMRYLYTLNLLPGRDPKWVVSQHERVMTRVFGAGKNKAKATVGNERIRIAYVSGDFCAHAVAYFLEPVLDHHSRSKFEIFCYSNVPRADFVTERFKALAEHWYDVTDWNDETFYQQILSDRIDILVDLAGHTSHGRLGVFVGKPAPVQISYLGYPTTTGLADMDYRIVDGYTVPADEELAGTESYLRLPNTFACYRPAEHTPPVQPAPVLANGYVTLGCLHRLEKINADVIEAWAEILHKNPGTRLFLARDQIDDWHQFRLRQLFDDLGIETKRLTLIRHTGQEQSFFELFSEIDIMLDTFPWSGHTMTCCALWMGVPVVTLKGPDHVGRMAASVLHAVGLDQWVAEDVESYTRIVGDLCKEKEFLVDIRSQLRIRFEASPLRNEEQFIKDYESTLVGLVAG